MSEFVLRQATPTDADRLAHIGVATFIDSYTFDIDGEAMVLHCSNQHAPAIYAQYLADPDARIWLAEYTGTGAPIGYALTCKPDLPVALQTDDIELKRIYVLSRFHGSGAGLALLNCCIEYARAERSSRLLLGTYEENHRAMAFYARHGFQQIGTRKFQVGNKVFDDVVLALEVMSDNASDQR